MTWAKIISKVQKDLDIPGKRAAAFVEIFRKNFNGFKEAIKEIEASYTNEGFIKIQYRIGEKFNSITIKNERKS